MYQRVSGLPVRLEEERVLFCEPLHMIQHRSIDGRRIFLQLGLSKEAAYTWLLFEVLPSRLRAFLSQTVSLHGLVMTAVRSLCWLVNVGDIRQACVTEVLQEGFLPGASTSYAPAPPEDAVPEKMVAPSTVRISTGPMAKMLAENTVRMVL